MTPAYEKAAPIPAEVLALAERLRSMGQDIRSWGPAYRDRARADMLRAAALLVDRASQEERIREDERDRLYAEAEMQHAAALLRQDAIAGDLHAGAALWLKECGKGAMFPRDRALLRGDAS